MNERPRANGIATPFFPDAVMSHVIVSNKIGSTYDRSTD